MKLFMNHEVKRDHYNNAEFKAVEYLSKAMMGRI